MYFFVEWIQLYITRLNFEYIIVLQNIWEPKAKQIYIQISIGVTIKWFITIK